MNARRRTAAASIVSGRLFQGVLMSAQQSPSPAAASTLQGVMPATPTEPQVENAIPVLAVTDVQASIRFYLEKLGFKLDWAGGADPPQIAQVSRDAHPIMLQCRGPVT